MKNIKFYCDLVQKHKYTNIKITQLSKEPHASVIPTYSQYELCVKALELFDR